MTTVTYAVYSDGTLQELLTDEGATPQHEYYDTDGVTLLSTADASELELDILRQARARSANSYGVLSGSGPPTDDIGDEGQLYVDVDSNFTYGPKAGGAWPVGVNVELARA